MFCDSCKAQFLADLKTPWVLDQAAMVARQTVGDRSWTQPVEQTAEGRWRFLGPITSGDAV